MKKLFISCPMRDRSEENIKKSIEKMHKIAEEIFEEELETIQSYIEDDPPKDSRKPVWYLGESIKLMSQADYFIGPTLINDKYPGCLVEQEIAVRYAIPSYMIRIDFVLTKEESEDLRKY